MNDTSQTTPRPELTREQQRLRISLVVVAGALFVVVLSGFIYLSTTVTATATYLLSFAGGISNIALPCTLPLVFIIVPMAMVASTRTAMRGVLMTLLFGLGLVITLGTYGATIGFAGQYLGLDTATRLMYGVAGVASLVFGLSELGLLKFSMPSYGGIPRFIQVLQNDYAKVFLLGLLLGNAGVGCPNPVTYVVLTFAATSGDWLQGALLMMVNGVGRVLPLLLLVILGILGVSAVSWLAEKTEVIKKFTAWVLIALASFIFLNGVFGHLWYEGGAFHEGLNAAFMSVGGTMIGEAEIDIEEFEKPVPFVEYGDWMNFIIILVPLFWYWRKNPQNKREILIVLAIFTLWALSLFDFGLSGMDWIGR